MRRLAPDNPQEWGQSGALIETLSLGIYDAVRGLLGRLRPRQLDDMSLEQAVRPCCGSWSWSATASSPGSSGGWRTALSDAQRVTLFRVCQEGSTTW